MPANVNETGVPGSIEHETDDDFFRSVDDVYGFTIDVCATKENAKVKPRFFCPPTHTHGLMSSQKVCGSAGVDGLAQSWQGHRVWMNPPYNKPEKPCKPKCEKKACSKRGYHRTVYLPGIGDWMAKAAFEASLGRCLVVSLIPASLGTHWWWDHVKGKAAVEEIKGRIRFKNMTAGAKFESVLGIYSPEWHARPGR